jgi:hypothetical protein
MTRAAVWLIVFIAPRPFDLHAGQAPAAADIAPRLAQSSPATPPPELAGPPPPVPPEVIARDSSGRATIRAVGLSAPLRIDGQLDESLYTTVPALSDFIQMEPQPGSAATERTEVWLTFDSEHVYVSFRCWETQPERLIAKEMRRDHATVWNGDDMVAFMLDTFYDRRNSVEFTINAIGGRTDGQISNERQWLGDWNPVWDVQVGRFDGGWTAEAALPFKSLRYRPGRAQVWGFNALRTNRWKNEMSFLMRMPAGRGQQALHMASLAATVVGLEAPSGSKNLEIKPYAISDLTSDHNTAPRISNDLNGDLGVDVKYGVTQNLTADFTYRTDFAQVEADEQQVNLTRFSLFFPEKREFFLENQGTFTFGGAVTSGQAALGGASDTPILFYSRRIGLGEERVVPIEGGGRLTGRLGRFDLGVLNIQSDEEPRSGAQRTNFSVVRLKRDLFRRSSLGLLLTRRSVAEDGSGPSDAYGVDGSFAFFDNLAMNTYWARTPNDDRAGADTSYRAQVDYTGDRYGAQLERLVVGEHFRPEVGFLRRSDIRKSFGLLRFSPRPRSFRSVRKFSAIGSAAYIENRAGRLEARNVNGEFAIEYHSSDRLSVAYDDAYEFLPEPFPIADDVTVPVGGYDARTVRAGFNLGPQRRVSGNFSAEHGTFYSGRKTAVGLSRGRTNITSQLSVEPSLSVNWVDLAEGSFTTHLIASRVTYTMTPLMFISALVQYNSGSHALSANVRLRWEYRPGSELFVVFNEQRDTLAPRFPALANRAVIVKINRLFRL